MSRALWDSALGALQPSYLYNHLVGRLPDWSALVSASHPYSLIVLALLGFDPILLRAGIHPSPLHSPTSAPDLSHTGTCSTWPPHSQNLPFQSFRPRWGLNLSFSLDYQLWRRKWQPTPLFLPEKSHGQRNLAGPSPRGCKESDMTHGLSTLTLGC